MLWSLKEHDIYPDPAWEPIFTFQNTNSSILRIDSYSNGTTSMGSGYCFKNFNRTWLNGKKIKIYSNAYYSGPSNRSSWSIAIYDGSYDRTSSTDFPDDAALPTKGAGQLFIYIRPAFKGWTGWETYTSSTLDLSSGTQDQCCLFIIENDGWLDQLVILDIDYIQILDSSNNVLLTANFTETLSMELTGTTHDYGYIGQDLPSQFRSITVEEKYYTPPINMPGKLSGETQFLGGAPLKASLQAVEVGTTSKTNLDIWKTQAQNSEPFYFFTEKNYMNFLAGSWRIKDIREIQVQSGTANAAGGEKLNYTLELEEEKD